MNNLCDVFHEARNLLTKYELVNWSFGFNNNVRRIGLCNFTEKRIELSKWFVLNNTMCHVLDCVLHEIAHSLSGQLVHNKKFRDKCKEIGCFCHLSRRKGIVMPFGKVLGVCPACDNKVYRHRRPRKLRCSNCREGLVSFYREIVQPSGNHIYLME